MIDFDTTTTERVTLSANGTMISPDGFRGETGLRVEFVPASDTAVETVEIGSSVHRAEYIEFLPDRIRSKIAEWEVLL